MRQCKFDFLTVFAEATCVDALHLDEEEPDAHSVCKHKRTTTRSDMRYAQSLDSRRQAGAMGLTWPHTKKLSI